MTGVLDLRLTHLKKGKSWLAVPIFILMAWMAMFAGGSIFQNDDRQREIAEIQVDRTARGIAWNVEGKVESIAFSPDGTKVATLVPNSRIDIWSLQSPEAVLSILENVGRSEVVFGPEGDWFAASNKDQNSLQLWNAQTGEPLRTFEDPTRLVCFALSHDGRWIATSHGDRAIIYVWERESGKRLRVYESNDQAKCLAFSPDDQQIVIGT